MNRPIYMTARQVSEESHYQVVRALKSSSAQSESAPSNDLILYNDSVKFLISVFPAAKVDAGREV